MPSPRPPRRPASTARDHAPRKSGPGKGSPNKAGLRKAGPSKAGPGKAAPNSVWSSSAVATKTATGKSGVRKLGPATRRSPAKTAKMAKVRLTSSATSASATPSATAPLTPTQRRYLRGLGHDLKPVIMLGAKGLTDAVHKELALALEHHELIKVRLSGADRDERQQQIDSLLESSHAELVQQIGHVACLFRRNVEEPKLALPR